MMVPDMQRIYGREFTDGKAQTILRAWRGNIRLDDLFIGRGQVERMGPRSASEASLGTMAGKRLRRSRAARLTSQSAMPAATWPDPVSALGRGSCIPST
ncbi:hypothetical protein QO001_000345 [Methylobacterium brachiatum]|jgi:hypothetical protein|uniref:Uncharacterized protein n=1 Tax=Methylobacterium brachiatum TaxID=269660 RepID=A0AAJ1WTY1_9HYPH|nr:hypothetical protein [Methylobacterium brachiatum]MCB4800801.1 hypothetical protein [Methylobacterium brachiatum]MDQ0541437.1 hypothetical protein [Methylobacterium brachiatum]